MKKESFTDFIKDYPGIINKVKSNVNKSQKLKLDNKNLNNENIKNIKMKSKIINRLIII